MSRADWMSIGLKLLGVYFGVVGLAGLWQALLGLIITRGEGSGVALLMPLVHLAAAFVLIFQNANCLRWFRESSLGAPPADTAGRPYADAG